MVAAFRIALTKPLDVQEGNVMLSVTDQSIFDDLVAEEWASPNPRKSTGRRVVHTSTPLEMPDDPGVPIITDSGDAKIGSGPFLGEVMPDLYRAPEIILGIPWDAKIDIWALGLMVIKPTLPSTRNVSSQIS